MAVEYDISSDVAVIKEVGSVSQCARVTQMYSGQITYDDEAGSKFATATINGKSQRVMLCIAVNGTVAYDDVPSLYSTVDGHRCLNIVTPTETGTPDDVPSLYETVVIDGQNIRAVRCIMINKTPVYDGVSSTCTFTGDDGKTHTAQLVNKVTGGSVVVIIKGTSPLNLPDAIANSLSYVKAFGGAEQNGTPTPDAPIDIITNNGVLKYGKQITLSSTRFYGYVGATGLWTPASDSYSIVVPVEVGKRYAIRIVDTNPYMGQNNAIFRGGFTSTLLSDTAIQLNNWFRRTPQDTQYIQLVATNPYLVIQCSASVMSLLLENDGLTVKEQTINTDGIVETISAHSKNLFDQSLFQTPVGATITYVSYPIKNGTYTMSTDCPGSASGTTANAFFLAGRVTSGASSNNNGVYSGHSITQTITDGWYTVAYRSTHGGTPTCDPADYDFQLEQGTSATTYTPYYNGGTATVEMLLKIGDYQDVQSIIDGVVTRNVGVKVLDGTENFETATATNCYSLTNTLGTGNFADRTIVCSHFASTPTMPGTGDRQGLAFIVNKGPEYTIAFGATTQFSTQALWQQFLADQYAAGTPVIVVYPLATPTTESVTGQTLQVQAGDNVLEVTQASLDGLELEAEYQAAVSLTIQEVEDANLDNNVEVTIS